MSLQKGALAEQQAQIYLVSQGLKWIMSNYRCRLGEIDLIMREGQDLVFVEVRSRAMASYGGALASVTYKKQQKLIKTALFYLSAHPLYQNEAFRFDVLCFEGKPPVIHWIKNAFGE